MKAAQQISKALNGQGAFSWSPSEFCACMWMCAALSRLPLQYIIEFTDRVLLHRRQDMTINVHGHADLVVPQKLLHDLRMHPHAQQNARRAVPEVVEANFRQSSLFQ